MPQGLEETERDPMERRYGRGHGEGSQAGVEIAAGCPVPSDESEWWYGTGCPILCP